MGIVDPSGTENDSVSGQVAAQFERLIAAKLSAQNRGQADRV